MFGINAEPKRGTSVAAAGPCQPCAPDICSLKKPEMRNLMASGLKGKFLTAFLIVATAATTFRIFHVHRRRQIYADFSEKYDETLAYADFERMKRVGVFQSVLPDGTPGSI